MSFTDPQVRKVWTFWWRDGSAVLTRNGSYGTLWLQADLSVGQYGWGAWGGEDPEKDFRRWIADAAVHSPDYICDKLCYGHPSLYDSEETDLAVRKWIIESRREGELDAENARGLWDLWVDSSPNSELEFYDWYRAATQEFALEHEWVINLYHSVRWGYQNFKQHLPELAAALEKSMAEDEPFQMKGPAGFKYEPTGL